MMRSPLIFQFAVGILTSMLVAGSWWYVAVRLPYHWVLYALAMLATIGAVISVGMVVTLQSHANQFLIPLLSQLRTGISLLEGILYVLFAVWITSRARSAS
ncbi:MAG: hypothetical protein ABI833_23980, partial [Acidobacteriota bacterium]